MLCGLAVQDGTDFLYLVVIAKDSFCSGYTLNPLLLQKYPTKT
jgi:hypothetical protein